MVKHKSNIIICLFGALSIGLPISKAVCSVAEVILFIIALTEIITVKPSIKKKQILIPSVLFLVYFISGIYSLNHYALFNQLKNHVPLILIPLSVWILNDYLENKKENLFILFIGSTFFSFICTVIYTYLPINWIEKMGNHPRFFLPHSLNATGMFGMTSFFIDRIQLSNLIGISTLFSIYLGFKRQKKIFILITVLMFLSSLFLGGRGGQIALFVALIIILSITTTQKLNHYWLIQKTSIFFPLIFISIILASFFLFSIKKIPLIKERYGQHNYELEMFKTKQYKPEDLINYTSIRRLISWKNSFELVKKNLILGTGIGDYESELKKEYDADKFNLPINHHSQYLYILGSAGIILFVVYLFSLQYACFLFSKQKEMVSIGIGFIVFYMVAFIPDAVLLRQVDCISYSLFFSLLLSKL